MILKNMYGTFKDLATYCFVMPYWGNAIKQMSGKSMYNNKMLSLSFFKGGSLLAVFEKQVRLAWYR